MNTYDMLCKNCKNEFEIYCSIAKYSEGNIECPYCQSNETHRDWTKGSRVVVNDQTKWRKSEYGGDDKR